MVLPFYWPTTVVIIDDDYEILEVLRENLKSEPYNFLFFTDPYEALEVIKSSDIIDSSRYLRNVSEAEFNYVYQEKRISIDVQALHTEIFNSNRFNIISIVIVDYNMPLMTGLEFIEKLKGYSSAKKIMLTSYLGHEEAIDLKGEKIDDYIAKSYDENIFDKVKNAIKKNSLKFFEELSYPVTLAITLDCKDSALKDKNFEIYFNRILKEQRIQEYYMIEDIGCYLLVAFNNRLSILHVETKEQAKATVEEYRGTVSEKVLTDLQSFQKVVCAYKDQHSYYPASQQIEEHLLPIQLVSGGKDYLVALKTDYTLPVTKEIKFFRSKIL